MTRDWLGFGHRRVGWLTNHFAEDIEVNAEVRKLSFSFWFKIAFLIKIFGWEL